MFKFALLTILSVLFIANASVVYAKETFITNTISVSSNSGGNTASKEVVVEGKTLSSVDVETEINGEIVTEIHESSDSEQISVSNSVIVSEGSTTVSTKLATSSEIKEVSMPTERKSGILKKISSLIEYVFSFFRT